MKVSRRFKRYYQSLRDINIAVFDGVAIVVYNSLYMVLVPIIWIIAPRRKKMTHTAWSKWSYKSETLEDLRKQY